MDEASKILVIDDEAHIRETLTDLLEFSGFEVVVAENGRRGVEVAKEETPDLILCDIMMPEMDGFQVAEQIRSLEHMAITPFIFLSARATMEDVREGMLLGADDYLTKPFNNSELIEAIQMRIDHINMLTGEAEESEESTEYLKTLQSMTIPSETKLQQQFREHFCLKLSAEEIASNFYWTHEVEDRIYLVSTHCSDGGERRSIINMICYEKLTRILFQNKTITPAQILQRLNKLLRSYVHTLSQGPDKNTMAIGVCMIDRSKKQLAFAGANRNILLYTSKDYLEEQASGENQSEEKELYEIQGDPDPLGGIENDYAFQEKVITLYDDDRIYLYSEESLPATAFHKKGVSRVSDDQPITGAIKATLHLSLEDQKDELEQFIIQQASETTQGNDVLLIGILP